MRKFDDAVSTADYFARIAVKVILTALEDGSTVTPELRKAVLDSVNDLKRNIVRYVYEVNE